MEDPLSASRTHGSRCALAPSLGNAAKLRPCEATRWLLGAVFVIGMVSCIATSPRKGPDAGGGTGRAGSRSAPSASGRGEHGAKPQEGGAKPEDSGTAARTAPAARPAQKAASDSSPGSEVPSDDGAPGSPSRGTSQPPTPATESTLLVTGGKTEGTAAKTGSGTLDPKTQAPPDGARGNPSVMPPPTENPRPPREGGEAETLRLSLEVSPSEARVGGIVTVEVVLATATRIVDAPLHLAYDPTALRFLDASAGDFLSQDGGSLVFLANGTSRIGEVVIGIGRTDRSRGMSGSGTLCRVRFIGISAGAAAVRIGQAMAWTERGASLEVLLDSTKVIIH